MGIIYKGTKYEVPIESPMQLVGARLYNLATRTVVNMVLSDEQLVEITNDEGEVTSSYYTYNASIAAADTAKIPQGIYNLELYNGDVGSEVIVAYYEHYAQVKESSFTQDYA